MDELITYQPISVLITGASLVVSLTVFLAFGRSLNKHFFFIFIVFTSLAYLFLAPTIELLNPSLPDLELFAGDYTQLQFFLFAFFLTPLILIYAYLARRNRGVSVKLEVARNKSILLALLTTLLALAFVVAISRNNLFFSRLGSETLAQAIVGLPQADFVIIRLYQESALFILGVLFFAWRLTSSRLSKILLGLALGINLLAWGSFIILNSRWMVVATAICLLGWWLALHQGRFWYSRQLLAAIFMLLIAAYFTSVVVNVRTLGFTARISAEYFVPRLVFFDTQGINRLNCVDLIARLNPEITANGPAWGAAWGNVYWLVYRFIDPEGFDRFRLTLNTTSKSYLMRTYLGWDRPDYNSCVLTDFYGNFHVLGLVMAAVVFGVLLAYQYRAISGYYGGAALIIGIFVLTHLIIFDQEASSLLFGWTRKLPVLVLFLILCPFRAARIRY